jgi:hypothetical protein
MDFADLSPEDVYNVVIEILSAEKIVDTGISKLPTIKIRYPFQHQKIYADYLEKKNLKLYLEAGTMSEDNILPDFTEEFFSTEDAEQAEELNSKIKSYRSLLLKRIKGSEQYDSDLQKIKQLEETRDLLLLKKSSVKQFTAEYRAREDKHFYLLSQCVSTLEGAPVWPDYETLLSDNTIYSTTEVYLLLNCFLDFYFGHPIKVIRKIARSATWRTYYIAGKEGVANLFKRVGADLTLDQLNLMGWSKWYDGIFEMSSKDRPSDSLLENDDALDKYISEFIRKINAEGDLNRRDSGKRAIDQDHVVVTAESGNYVKFQKQGMYSDTSLISGRAKEGATGYNESKETTDLKKRIAKAGSK